MRTFYQAKQWAIQQLHESPSDTVLTALVSRWVQRSRNRILRYRDWHWNRGGPITLTWNASGILYLPSYVDRLLTVRPVAGTGWRIVRMVTATEIDRWLAMTSVNPSQAVLVSHGLFGVQADMPAAGVVTATSSGGATNQTARIEGLDVNGNDQSEDLAVTAGGASVGTSTFAAGVEGVRRISLIGDGTGTPVTDTGIVTFTSGGATLQRLDSARHVALEHWRTELRSLTSAVSYEARFIKKHYPPLRDQDIIDVPEYFHDLIEIGLQIELAKFRQRMEELVTLKADWNEAMLEALAWDRRQPGKRYSIRVRREWGRSL